MSWHRERVLQTPISKKIQQPLTFVSELITTLNTALVPISAALDAAKVFIVGTVDPFVALVSTALTSLEQLNNDFFSTGFYNLNITPYDIEGVRRFNPTFTHTADGFFSINDPKAPKGFPLMTPQQAISAAIASFDDLGDIGKPTIVYVLSAITSEALVIQTINQSNEVINITFDGVKSVGQVIREWNLTHSNTPIQLKYGATSDTIPPAGSAVSGQLGGRPQFSNSATVTAFGVLATAPSIDEFLELILAMMNIFHMPAWEFTYNKIVRVKSTLVPSVKPDWNSVKLNSYGYFAQLQRYINDLIFTLRGYLVVADNNIADLISIIQKKVTKLQELLNKLSVLIANISNLTGLYTFNLPPKTGGNNYIKQQLHDSILESSCLNNGYTILSLFVGGGTSLEPVNIIRESIFKAGDLLADDPLFNTHI